MLTLSSYDIVDRCSTFIKGLNHKNVEWNFELGDVTRKFYTWNLATECPFENSKKDVVI